MGNILAACRGAGSACAHLLPEAVPQSLSDQTILSSDVRDGAKLVGDFPDRCSLKFRRESPMRSCHVFFRSVHLILLAPTVWKESGTSEPA